MDALAVYDGRVRVRRNRETVTDYEALHDRHLRLAADFENFKKRTVKEQAEAQDRGREALLKELLPVIDNLERAIKAAEIAGEGSSIKALSDGVRLVDKQMHLALDKFDVRAFCPVGVAFDPAMHEAVQFSESPLPPGCVAQVYANGYTIGERLLRPAMVSVTKAQVP